MFILFPFHLENDAETIEIRISKIFFYYMFKLDVALI